MPENERLPDTLIENVSDTAFWVAHHRAVESARADALFCDPLAGLLAGSRGEMIAAGMPMAGMTAWIVVMRTCIIDDYIRVAVAEGVDVILNLGAGLDTRPYRMDLPESLVWIEADYPQVIDFKQTRLAAEVPKCRLERVKVDLADPASRGNLLAGANARARKLLVLTEGVLPYLSIEEVASLAGELRALDHVCYWIVDYLSPESQKFRKRYGMTRKLQNAPFKFMPADWFGFFGKHGWRAKETRYMAQEAERLRRPIPLPLLVKVMVKLRWLLSSQKRREDMERFSAYVLLEPK